MIGVWTKMEIFEFYFVSIFFSFHDLKLQNYLYINNYYIAKQSS